MTDRNFLLTFYERDLVKLAQCYDLEEPAEKDRSVSDLEALFFRIIRYIEAPLFIEAGAKDATVSARARKNLKAARIVAFEANPFNYEAFSRQSHISACNIEYLHFALSNSDDPITFSVQVEAQGKTLSKVQGIGSLRTPQSDEISVEEVEVQSVSLDSFFEGEQTKKGAIWIDVEGAHDKVLPGGKALLAENMGAVFMEVEDRELWEGQWLSRDVHAFMLDLGFIPCARDFQSRYQYNVLYLHPRVLEIDYVKYCLTMHMSYAGKGLVKKMVASHSSG